jgi:hypothetical protein
MFSWPDSYHSTLTWLLDHASPGIRYLALRDLLSLSDPDPELQSARSTAHKTGPIAIILDQMHPDGYWVEPGTGYLPKYRSIVWSLLLLAQLGAHVEEDVRIAKACTYLVEHTLSPLGQFTTTGAPSGTADCLQGNMLWALMALGYNNICLEKAFDWMARSVTGEGIAPASDRKAAQRYYAGKCGPNFACGANNKLPCAWGAVKVMLAFSQLPRSDWTPTIARAVEQGAEFLLDHDPVRANYPNGWSDKPSRNWWKFGFPVFYVTDLLQNIEALILSGYEDDARVKQALAFIAEKQDDQGRWLLEYDYTDKTWCNFGVNKQPNPWVTLRALRVLRNSTAAPIL